MLNQFSRTQLLLGKEAMDRLKGARVAVFGRSRRQRQMCIRDSYKPEQADNRNPKDHRKIQDRCDGGEDS